MDLCRYSLFAFLFCLFANGDPAGDLASAALDRTKHKVTYDPSYVKIPFPNGDVPPDKGVCTDVIIRSYRQLGIDLQKEVFDDMKGNFSVYPKKFALTRPDPNIDHRRVPNLMTFLKRKGAELPITQNSKDYAPGDVVTWEITPGVTHIGIVSSKRAWFMSSRHLIVHNIGAGDVAEDVMFNWKIIGHYRWFGSKPQ